MCHCVEMFRLTPLKYSHKVCITLSAFTTPLKHNKYSSNNHITIIRNVFQFTLKVLGHRVHCAHKINNVTGLLQYQDNYVSIIYIQEFHFRQGIFSRIFLRTFEKYKYVSQQFLSQYIFCKCYVGEKFVSSYINNQNMTVNNINQFAPLQYSHMPVLYHKHPT